MKRILSLVIALTVLAGIVMGSNTQAVNKKSFRIGFPWDTTSTDPTFKSVLNNVKAAVEGAGGKLVVVENDFTPNGTINNIDELLSMRVNGIIFMPVAESVLPRINQMCTKARVPYATMFRAMKDKQIQTEISTSRYFAGGCYEDEENTAYNAITEMAAIGVKNLCVINLDKGDASGDSRELGIEKAARNKGIKVLTIARGLLQQTDVTRTVESFIAAYPEMDGIFIAGTYAPGCLPTLVKSLSDHKLAGKVKVGRIDFDSTMGEYLKNGSFNVAYGGQQQIDPLLSTVILVNRVMGKPLANKPSFLKVNYLKLNSYQEAEDFLKFFQGNIPVYTKEEIKSKLLKYYHPSVDEATLNQTIQKFSIKDVVNRHKDLVK